MPKKKIVKVHTLTIPPVCEAKHLLVYNQPMTVIGYCYYDAVSIKKFILDNRLYDVYIVWCGETEHWWLDSPNDESAYKYP